MTSDTYLRISPITLISLLYFTLVLPPPFHLLKLISRSYFLLKFLHWINKGLLLSLLLSLVISCYLKILHRDSMPLLTLTFRRLLCLMGFLLLYSKAVPPCFLLCLVNSFQLCLARSIFSSCWKFACIQSVLIKGDHCNTSNYYPRYCSISCFLLYPQLEDSLTCHCTIFNLFRQDRSTSDLFFLTDSWLSPFGDFGRTFTVAIDIKNF